MPHLARLVQVCSESQSHLCQPKAANGHTNHGIGMGSGETEGAEVG